MPNLNFATQVSDWVKNVKEAHEAVFHEAAQRVTHEMNTPRGQGGNVPVDTGFLWHSLLASDSAMPVIRPDAKPDRAGHTKGDPPIYKFDAGPVELTIKNVPIGGKIYLGYIASYARYVNDGTHGRPGAMFVELAAQRWPQIVKEVEGELLKQARE